MDKIAKQREALNMVNMQVAMAMRAQLQQIGINPADIDLDNDISESHAGGAIQKITHYHYLGMLLVEVIRKKNKAGYSYQINVPKRETDGQVIKDKDGHVSTN